MTAPTPRPSYDRHRIRPVGYTDREDFAPMQRRLLRPAGRTVPVALGVTAAIGAVGVFALHQIFGSLPASDLLWAKLLDLDAIGGTIFSGMLYAALFTALAAFMVVWSGAVEPRAYRPWRLRGVLNLVISTAVATTAGFVAVRVLGWSNFGCAATATTAWWFFYGLITPWVLSTRYRRRNRRELLHERAGA